MIGLIPFAQIQKKKKEKKISPPDTDSLYTLIKEERALRLKKMVLPRKQGKRFLPLLISLQKKEQVN